MNKTEFKQYLDFKPTPAKNWEIGLVEKLGVIVRHGNPDFHSKARHLRDLFFKTWERNGDQYSNPVLNELARLFVDRVRRQ